MAEKIIQLNMEINEGLDNLLLDLMKKTRKGSREDIFKLSVVLLKIALEQRDQGCRIAAVREDGTVVREIVLPGASDDHTNDLQGH